MSDIERYAAENARLKAILEQQGFKITYKPTGEINKITAPRRPMEKHTAINWAKRRGYKGSVAAVRRMTKDKAITARKFKNAVERAELIRDAKAFLLSNGYKVPDKFFDKVPTYVLKNNDFYENVNAILNSSAESDETELDNSTINHAMDASVDRIKRLTKAQKDPSRLANIAKKAAKTNAQTQAMNKITKNKPKNTDPAAISNIAQAANGATIKSGFNKMNRDKKRKLK
jgi:hypothetical protein